MSVELDLFGMTISSIRLGLLFRLKTRYKLTANPPCALVLAISAKEAAFKQSLASSPTQYDRVDMSRSMDYSTSRYRLTVGPVAHLRLWPVLSCPIDTLSGSRMVAHRR